MNKGNRFRRHRLVIITITAVLLLAILLIVLDWNNIRQIVGKANWEWTLVALLFTVISYLCLSFGYVIVNRIFKIRISWLELLQVGLVSTTLNNILAFLGAAGHSLRLALIRRPGVLSGEILAASIFHSYVNNVMMLLLLAVGLVMFLASHIIYGGNTFNLGLVTGLAVLTVAVATAILLFGRLRAWSLHVIGALWHLVTRHDITRGLNEFGLSLGNGVLALRTRWVSATALMVLMAADWAFAAVAVWFCLDAFSNPPVAVLLLGFGIGISAGNISMLPGGLGIPFSQGILAAILFRVVYDFIPFFASLFLYRGLIRKNREANNPPDNYQSPRNTRKTETPV
jgi:uncharacterized protein (TIRG00374 family)